MNARTGDCSSIAVMSVNFMDSAYAANPDGEVVATEVAYRAQGRSAESSGIYATILRWTLLVGVFLLPLFFLPWTTGILELNKQLVLMVVAGVGLIAWLLSLVSTGHLSWRANSLDKGVLAILGASLIATIFSISRFTSLFGTPGNLSSSLVSLIAVTVLYFLIVNSSEEDGANLQKIFGISLTLALVYGLLQILGVYLVRFPFALSQAFNTIGSPDALGIVAAISLPMLGIGFKKSWSSYVNMAGFIAALAILVILNWWVLWVVAVAGMVGLIAFGSLLSGEKSGFSVSRFILPMTVIVLGVFLSVVHFNLSVVKNNLPIEVSPSFQLSGQVTKSVLNENLIVGYGPETFSIAFDKFGASQLSNSTLSSAKFFAPNAEAFNLAVEGGLLAILAAIVLLLSAIQAVIYAIRNRAHLNPSAGVLLSTLLALGAAVFLYPLNISLLSIGYIVLGLTGLVLWARNTRVLRVEDSAFLSMGSSLGFIAGLILVLVGVYFVASNYVADAHYANATRETAVDKAANELVSAVNWNGQSDTYYRGASQAALGLLSQELNKKAEANDTQRTARIQNYMSSAINLAKKATELGPRESANWDNLGGVYQNLLGLVDGMDKLSETAYLKAAELRPGDASYHNKIGNLYLAKASLLQQLAQQNKSQQMLDEARAALGSAEVAFKKAIEISNNFGLAIYNLGVVYDQQGRLVEAIKQLEKIAPFNSDQPNLLFQLGLLYYRNGEKDKAFNALQQVLVLSPDFANAHWYQALIYEERKDIPNAIAQLEKILSVEANKDNKTVLDKLQQLRSGEVPPTTDKGINQKPL